MFEEENLLKFEPFLFKNGAVPKPKYFVVLRTWRAVSYTHLTLPTNREV